MSRLLLAAAAVSSVACHDRAIPALSAAARRGDLVALHDLLDGGADPNDPGPGGTRWPPLLHAVHTHQLEAARLLLDSGASPDSAAPNGYTALMLAAAERDTSMLALLLDRGADAHRAGPGGITALSEAITVVDEIGRDHSTVRVLLDRVPDLAWSQDGRFWLRLDAELRRRPSQ